MATRDYEAPGIRVHWDSTLCIHSAICLNTLPGVFDTRKRPWIDINGASPDDIHAAVAKCPSGALAATLTEFDATHIAVHDPSAPEHGPDSRRDAAVKVTLRPNGPLMVEGDIELLAADGAPIDAGDRVFLCRCGSSARKPFCDGTHAKVGFEA